MVYKAFLGINILIDFIDENRKEHLSANQLFHKIADGSLSAYVSESIINTTFYLTSKLASIQSFRLFIQDALQFLTFLPCTNADILHACNIVKNDFEDAVLYGIALSNKMNFFITTDSKDLNKIAQPAVKVVSASQMLTLL
jgi:predicted nucleic acid-binding protein